MIFTVMHGALFLSGALVSSREITAAAAGAVEVEAAAAELADPSAASPVPCSLELNAYCPPSTTCCPRRKKKISRTLIGSTDDVGSDDPSDSEIVGYSCLMSWSSRFPQGPCCVADLDDEGPDAEPTGSGCAVGYTCAAASVVSPPSFTALGKKKKEDGDSLALGPHCRRDDEARPVDKTGHQIQNEYERMPRYRTCPAFAREDVEAPHALPIPLRAASYHKTGAAEGPKAELDVGEDGDAPMGRLAYFTNMGPLAGGGSPAPSPSQEGVTTAVIGIHGSGRDAGSYLCAVIAAVSGASPGAGLRPSAGGDFDLNPTVFDGSLSPRRRNAALGDDGDDPEGAGPLVIAPWFLSPSDGLPESASSSSAAPFLRWVDEDAPIEHTFRYGAESIPADEDEGEATISSFGAMDVLLETLCDRRNYPNLKRIVVAGHSAGGQFVHRWGLSSGSWCFGGEGDSDLPTVRLVPANPRSYAYLTERRYLPTESEGTSHLRSQHSGGDKGDKGGSRTLSPFDELELRLPNEEELRDCPEYNRYCWGVEDNPDLPAPYISVNIEKATRGLGEESDGDDGVFCRYASRDIIYLSGERDTKQLGNQICDEDGYQGPSRRERSERFYASLQARGRENTCGPARVADSEGGSARVHGRIVVKDVGHDHALIFQSPEGLEGMFS